jgi:PIN domain nuclease of toxin-antitoxin system
VGGDVMNKREAMNLLNELTQELEDATEQLGTNMYLPTIKLEFQKKLNTAANHLKKLDKKILNYLEKQIEPANTSQFAIKRAILQETKKLKWELYRHHKDPIERQSVKAFSAASKRKEVNKNQIPALRFLSEPLRVQKEDMLIEYHTGEILSAMDQKVFMGLQALWKTKGEGQRVLFTYYELAQLIGFPTKGSGYRLIDEALNSLFNTRIFLHQTEQIEELEVEKQGMYRLISSIQKTNLKKGASNAQYYEVCLGDLVYESLKQGFYSYISMPLIRDLQSDTAQILYVLLCSLAPKHKIIEEELTYFVDMLGMSVARPAIQKNILENAIRELVENKILDGYEIVSEGRGRYLFRLNLSDIITAKKLLQDPIQEQAENQDLPFKK